MLKVEIYEAAPQLHWELFLLEAVTLGVEPKGRHGESLEGRSSGQAVLREGDGRLQGGTLGSAWNSEGYPSNQQLTLSLRPKHS